MYVGYTVMGCIYHPGYPITIAVKGVTMARSNERVIGTAQLLSLGYVSLFR